MSEERGSAPIGRKDRGGDVGAVVLSSFAYNTEQAVTHSDGSFPIMQ